jgi:PEP-CTERM motif
MIKINGHHFVRLLLLATALPFGLLAADAMSAHAGTVTITGANGATGAPGKPGSAGGAATATATSSDPSNSATATGGNGGVGGPGGLYYPPGAGGHGGAASSTATASSTNGSAGSASATATSTGGNGGRGGIPNPCMHSCFPGAGGGGGVASAVSSATGGGAGTVVSNATATGGAAPLAYNNPAAGTASASASASSTGNGLVEANASAFDPSRFTGEYYLETGYRASVTASAQNESGSIVTTASAPRGSTASTLSSAAVFTAAMGAVPESLVTISAGHAVSDAVLTPGGGPTIGVGAMSVGYGATSFAITYDATAVFDFTTSAKEEALDLSRFSSNSVPPTGLGFDNLLLWVDVDGNVYSFSTTSLSAAETFFAPEHSLPLGTVAAGKHSIEIEYSLTYNSGTAAASNDGFGFTYELMDPPLNVPEPSTWAMLIMGFVGLGVASWRRSRGPDSPARLTLRPLRIKGCALGLISRAHALSPQQ